MILIPYVRHEYTVEHEDRFGVTYFDMVMACSITDAKERIRGRRPYFNIRAVTKNPSIKAKRSRSPI